MATSPSCAAGPDGTPQITNASAPFNKSTADVVLRSSDSVDFRVHKTILAEASPVFESMFGLPQPSSGEAKSSCLDELKDDLPVIEVEESSLTLDTVLRFCYPLPQPTIGDVDLLQSLLRAVLKYDMDGILEAVRPQMRQLAEKHALQLYSIALRLGLEEEARYAAKCSLSLDIRNDQYVAELEDITGGDYFRLLDYHKKCSVAAGRVSYIFDWIKSTHWVWFTGHPSPGRNDQCSLLTISVLASLRSVAVWWQEHMSSLGRVTDFRPCGSAVLQAGTNSTVIQALKCPVCRLKALPDLIGFTELYAAEVDRVTSEVQLEIKAEPCKSQDN
ncbi:hypothetical protein WOLCODRAFT_140317 [Wolfiporia cocos MD-104 SS10]|uniref:BTB domain-containing protein n=1 Tax=Wolfiporia cocos (strain MD-104) TaxID=742152 RepID=A0A2H3JJV0_WOLCO|nr:hypothetical protein WOLCODRAFT_140317 [Wolfiporia cocos MD-104 SS10]